MCMKKKLNPVIWSLVLLFVAGGQSLCIAANYVTKGDGKFSLLRH